MRTQKCISLVAMMINLFFSTFAILVLVLESLSVHFGTYDTVSHLHQLFLV